MSTVRAFRAFAVIAGLATIGAMAVAPSAGARGTTAHRTASEAPGTVVQPASGGLSARQPDAESDSLGEVQARLAEADARRRQLVVAVGQAIEQYDAATHRLDRAKARLRTLASRARLAVRTTNRTREAMAKLAATSYQFASGLYALSGLITASRPTTLVDRATTVRMVTTAAARRYDELRASRAVTTVLERQARKAHRDAQAAMAQRAAAKRRVLAALAAQERVVARLQDERDELLRRRAELERARQRALQERVSRQSRDQVVLRRRGPEPEPARRRGGRVSDPRDEGSTTKPTDSVRQRVVDFAVDQLGEPYVFGADGPSAWDCSGLTMRAWESVGVSLPHYSRGQYRQSVPIARDELRPGDLVFWASNAEDPDTIYHVGLYVGHDQMVHAPRPGRTVERRPVSYMGEPTHFGRVHD
ncbi:MAG TPA: NlpC/P60 family protein [Actinopolymorphaceae bacterium]|jgi:cell wall-associated NlpC family hydrolase